MDCGTKRDWRTVPKQYRCGSRLVPWQDYFGTDTVLEFLLGLLHMQQAYFNTQYNVVSATDITAYVTVFLVLAALLYGFCYVIYRRFIRQMLVRRPVRRNNRETLPRPATRTPPPAYENHPLTPITTTTSDSSA